MARHSALRRRLPMIGMIAVTGMLAVVSEAAAAVKPTCRVVNQLEGSRPPPDSGQTLAAAISAATAGDELTVIGSCTGTYTLDKDLTLTGLSTKRFPLPTLDGGHAGATLTVNSGVTATVTNLVITGGNWT